MSADDERALGLLVDRYTASLDQGGFDPTWAQSQFTDDVVLQYPVGSHTGRCGADVFISEIMQRWADTHHHAGTCLIEVTGEHATLRWSIIASHVPAGIDGKPIREDSFQLGGWFSAEARRTPAGWRFAQMSLQIVWTRGTPVVDVRAPAVLKHV